MAVAITLNNKNAQVNALYGNDVVQKAGRVYKYMKDAPACSVFPSTLGIVCKQAAIGAAAGAIGGAVIGGVVGIALAYNKQETKYKAWLRDERNTKINNEVIALLKAEIAKGAEQFQDFLDPVHQNFMEVPVIDPSGQVFDLEQNRAWIEKHGTSPINQNQRLNIRDLRIDYQTHGRLAKTYAQLIRQEIQGIALNENQRTCINLLLHDLKAKTKFYYKEARKAADAEFDADKITCKQHAARLSRLAADLDQEQ